MLRKLLIPGVAAACLLAPLASAQTPVTLMPGVTADDEVQFTAHGPVAMHVVRAPRPGGLYSLRALLSNDAILGRETLTALQKRLSPQLTAVSVNGDYTSAKTGEPSGMLLRDGVLDHPPLGARSSAGVDTAGALHVDRVSFFGTWRGTGQRRPLNGVNEAPNAGEVVLFTSSYGGPTPRAPDAVDAVLAPFPAAAVNTDLQGTVTQLVPGGGTVVPPGGAVLQARGATIAGKLQAEAPAGTVVTTRLILKPEWTGVAQALGGGPVLVKNGKAIFRSNEAFEPSGLLPRSARTAVGQLADGRILLVTVDGDQPGYSVGMSNFELALALQRLGAQWAMALAPDTASAMAFDGTLLSRPAGREQPVAEALSIVYTGVYAPPLDYPVISPNGDGYAEGQTLAYKLVRKSTVHATLVGPGGLTLVLDDGPRDPGTYRFPFTGLDPAGAPLPEGPWKWTVSATDDQGAVSTADRTFSLDKTLGPLKLSSSTVRFGKKSGSLTVSTELTRGALLTLQVETPDGVVVGVVKEQAGPGAASLVWDGSTLTGKPAPSGRYVADVSARSAVGLSSLQAPFTLRRVSGK